MGLNGKLYSFSDDWVIEKRSRFGGHIGTAISAAYEAPEYEAYMETFGEFKAGDTVKFREGTLASQEVQVTEILNTEARIAFELFGIKQDQLVSLTALIKV